MKKVLRNISAAVASVVIASTMAVSAFAAELTYKDVITAADKNGAPDNNVAELKNYLEANQGCFNSEDYAYMISQIEEAGAILKDALGVDPSTLSDAELRTAIKGLDKEIIDQIKALVTETAATFGVKVEFSKEGSVKVSVSATAPTKHADGSEEPDDGSSKPDGGNPQVQTGDDGKAADTGAEGFGTTEAVAAVAIALAGLGFAVNVKLNKKED